MYWLSNFTLTVIIKMLQHYSMEQCTCVLELYLFLNVLNELWETFAFLSYTRLIYLFNKVMYLTCIRSELWQKQILQLPLFVITHIFFFLVFGWHWKKGLTCKKIVLSLTVNGNYMTRWKVLWGIWGKRAICHVHLLLFRIPDFGFLFRIPVFGEDSVRATTTVRT